MLGSDEGTGASFSYWMWSSGSGGIGSADSSQMAPYIAKSATDTATNIP